MMTGTKFGKACWRCAAVALFLLLLCPAAQAAETLGAVERGAYLVKAAGCVSCHTDRKGKGAPLAGGHALKTPFGTYYSPNITPDAKTGIGGWSDQDFLNALWKGVAPDGDDYFPVFPYTTYTKMHRADALAIKAYLFSLKPVVKANKAHDVGAPFGWRWPMTFWKWLYFTEARHVPPPGADETLARGAYLVEALAHCGECHTPRNFAGALDHDMWMAGTRDGPDGEIAPNITPASKTGIGEWSADEIVTLLREGVKPDYDDIQGVMGEAIEDGLAHLTDTDLAAIAAYVLSLPAIENDVESKR